VRASGRLKLAACHVIGRFHDSSTAEHTSEIELNIDSILSATCSLGWSE
jgi:hypothetical protein